MGWGALKYWDEGASRVEQLTGGSSNEVWSVLINDIRHVARLGSRDDADLAWETDLLRFLDQHGIGVPAPLPTRDGRLFAEGMVVMPFIDGTEPQSLADWKVVAATLRKLHALTRTWPQRPGWRTSLDYLSAEKGTRIDLTAMPEEAVAQCRAAWARLAGRPTTVVHGNPNNPANIRMTPNGVVLLDWDEARVDFPELDLALPLNGAGLNATERDMVEQASAAWEAAVCWKDDYAVQRLAEVRPV